MASTHDPAKLDNSIHTGIDIEALPTPNTTSTSTQCTLTLTIVKWEPNDPQHPKNWPMRQKLATTMFASAFTLMPPVASTMVAPGLTAIMRDLNVTSKVEGQLAISVFLLAYAIGPLLLAPLSEVYGRLPILRLSNAWFFCFNLGCGFAQTKEQMFAFRFLSGLGGSAPLAIGGGVVNDCFHPEQKGRAASIYSLTPLLGPAIGPIAGGFITQYSTWRWTFWATSIACVVIQGVAFWFQRESYAPKILSERVKQMRKETGIKELCTELETDVAIHKVLGVALERPFRLLATQPIVQILAIYVAYLNGVIYLVLSTFPGLWRDVYDESVSIGGLNYISMGIGLFLGAQAMGPLNDAIYKRLKAKNAGVGKPEFRVPVIFVGSVLVPLGLFWYGWSAQERLHWIMPNIGAAVFAAGTIICMQSIQTYIFDTYLQYAASALAACMTLRSLAGFGFPLFAPLMYKHLHYGWGNSILGFAAVALGIPAPFFFWKFGESLRSKSKFASG